MSAALSFLLIYFISARQEEELFISDFIEPIQRALSLLLSADVLFLVLLPPLSARELAFVTLSPIRK